MRIAASRPIPQTFARYAPWRDSLASQLQYHHLLSQVAASPVIAPRFPEPGDHFQEFAIQSMLGQGGAARVYRARNDLLGGREFVLKVSPDRGPEPSIMGRLDHEHIVPVYYVLVQPETCLRGLVMPYRPGLPLDDVIRRIKLSGLRSSGARVFADILIDANENPPESRDERVPGPRTDVEVSSVSPGGLLKWEGFPRTGTHAQGVAWIIAALARALAHAHGRDIQHRDIKPANILLTLENGPQLLDFNLAHDLNAVGEAAAALRGGTLPYMAPEQLVAFLDPLCWERVGPKADVYSLGLVMHEAPDRAGARDS